MGASCEAAVEMKRRKEKKTKNELKLITALRIAFVSSIPMATHLELCNAALMQEHFCIPRLYLVNEQSYRILRRNVFCFFVFFQVNWPNSSYQNTNSAQVGLCRVFHFFFFCSVFVHVCLLQIDFYDVYIYMYLDVRSTRADPSASLRPTFLSF